MGKAHGQLIKDCLLCLRAHGFNVLDPGKVSVKTVERIGSGIVWKTNTGTAERASRFVRFGVSGTPDIIGFSKSGKFVGVEIKTGRDTLSEDQKSFGHWLEASGSLWIVARSYEDLDISLKHHELNNRF